MKKFIALFLFLAARSVFPATDQQLKILTPKTAEQISSQGNYVLKWSASNFPAGSLLSLRLVAKAPAQESYLITSVFDMAFAKKMAAAFHKIYTNNEPTIESGSYNLNLADFCKRNRLNGKTICKKDAVFKIEAILRAANDPCSDKAQCAKRVGIYKSVTSNGSLAFTN